MVTREVYIGREDGLSIIAVSDLVRFLRGIDSKVELNYNGKTANCRSMISLMALVLTENVKVVISAEGETEEEDMEKLCQFLKTWG